MLLNWCTFRSDKAFRCLLYYQILQLSGLKIGGDTVKSRSKQRIERYKINTDNFGTKTANSHVDIEFRCHGIGGTAVGMGSL